MTAFKEKFVAFVDILGFKAMIEAAERGEGRPLAEIDVLLAELENAKSKSFFESHGPQICPHSSYLQKTLDFEITQVSDCAIVSAEISPAGVVNLVHHCWAIALNLLAKGVMVRGYITRGMIHHEGSKFRGTGYHTAFAREGNVQAFKHEADEKGTPFIEIDASVCKYVAEETDPCVKKMFGRCVKSDGECVAIFPFQSLSHSFIIGDYMGHKFDPEKERRSNNNLRKWLRDFLTELEKYVDQDNESAQRKVDHYRRALNEQLKICDTTDEFLDSLSAPFSRRR